MLYCLSYPNGIKLFDEKQIINQCSERISRITKTWLIKGLVSLIFCLSSILFFKGVRPQVSIKNCPLWKTDFNWGTGGAIYWVKLKDRTQGRNVALFVMVELGWLSPKRCIAWQQASYSSPVSTVTPMREGKSVSYAAVLYTGAWVTTCTVRAMHTCFNDNKLVWVAGRSIYLNGIVFFNSRHLI